jgi:hypothetical protein
MPKKIAKLLQYGDKIRRRDTGEILLLTHVGAGIVADVLLVEWYEGGEHKYAYVSPPEEFEVVIV